MKRIAAIAFLALATAGCHLGPPAKRMQWPAEEYAALKLGGGTATIHGQAFLRTVGGDVKTAAGSEVSLNPVTTYSRQWYQIAYVEGRRIAEPDKRILSFIQKTVADADGRFTFHSVAPGHYYVSTTVIWGAPSSGGIIWPQGGIVAKEVAIEDGETIEIVVTR